MQFAVKGGLRVERVLDGSSQEIHLTPTDVARRRAYGAFRFRLGLARDFYRKQGFQEIGPMPNFLIPGSAEILLRKTAGPAR